MLTSIIIKYLVPLVSVIGLLFGFYMFADSQGYSRGYEKGHTDGWKQQQITIDKLVLDDNKEREVRNNQISLLESAALKAQHTIFLSKSTNSLEREKIISQYNLTNLKSDCGLTLPTISSINELLNIGTKGN